MAPHPSYGVPVLARWRAGLDDMSTIFRCASQQIPSAHGAGVQCSTLNIQTMTRGFASHLGKLAQKAVFVAAPTHRAPVSARGRVNGAATDWMANG